MHVVLYTEPSSVPIQCGASATPPHDAASGQIPRKTYEDVRGDHNLR